MRFVMITNVVCAQLQILEMTVVIHARAFLVDQIRTV